MKMSSMKKIGICMGSSFFIAHIKENGIHKIQSYPRNENGIKEFLVELDKKTVIGIEKSYWTGAFIKYVKPLIKEYVILPYNDLMAFTSLTDETELAEN